MTRAEDARLRSGARPPSARAWPSVIPPLGERGLDRRARSSSRSVLATVDAGPADPRGDLLVGVAELVDELPVGERGLDRVEVLALEVLDERELELLVVGELADDRRDPLQAGRDRRPAGGARRRRAGSRRGSRSRGSAGGRRARGCSPRAWPAPPRRSAGAAGAGSSGSGRSGSRSAPAGRAWRCGMSDARPRPRLCGRSGRTVMRPPPARAVAAGLGIGAGVGRRGHDGHRGPAGAGRAAGAELVGERGGTRRRRGVRAVAWRSAGRGSAPRTGGRCAGSRSRRPSGPRWRRTSAATSADRFVRPSYIVSTTPSMASAGFRWSRTRSIVASSWVSPSRA